MCAIYLSYRLSYLSIISGVSYLSIISVYHIYLSYLQCHIYLLYLSIISGVSYLECHIYLSYLSIISIYHIYLSYLSIISVYHIYSVISIYHMNLCRPRMEKSACSKVGMNILRTPNATDRVLEVYVSSVSGVIESL